MAADCLTHSFSKICSDFEKLHPECDVILETQGSILISRMALLRSCDVLAVSDYRLVKQILEKESDWVIKFATTEMALVWTTQSTGSDEISSNNWHEILLRDDVKLGLASPKQDPCGYFTLMCWKLQEKYLKTQNRTKSYNNLADKLSAKVPPEQRAFDSGKLLARLQAFNTDYALAYKCQAEDMHMPYLPLPPQINLGSEQFSKLYKSITVNIPDYKGSLRSVTGAPIELGITIPQSCRNNSFVEEFIKFVLSKEGTNSLKRSYLNVCPPQTIVWGEKPAFFDKLNIGTSVDSHQKSSTIDSHQKSSTIDSHQKSGTIDSHQKSGTIDSHQKSGTVHKPAKPDLLEQKK